MLHGENQQIVCNSHVLESPFLIIEISFWLNIWLKIGLFLYFCPCLRMSHVIPSINQSSINQSVSQSCQIDWSNIEGKREEKKRGGRG